jgi:hypothetical protein
MKTIILSFLVLISFNSFTQADNLPGYYAVYENRNGSVQKKIITLPENYTGGINIRQNSTEPFQTFIPNNSTIRWEFTDPIAIGDRVEVSGNGLYQVTGWDLNTERISLYGNSGNAPLWEYPSNPEVFINNVSISDTGGIIANGSYHNIYLFNRSSNVPFFNFNLETALPDTGIAGPLSLTNDGRFLVASVSGSDSSTVFGFWNDSPVPVWSFRIGQTGTSGAVIQGLNISGNDSVFIVNTYGGFYVLRTYTGELLYSGLINPSSPSRTQARQGISGDGSIIATINYSGYVRVYQWNGSTYNFLWQHQEPPGAFFNWMFSVDVSYDGNYIACGTLNFLTSSSFDGKVKLFRTTSSTPEWTYTGFGDAVPSVSFSKNGNILTACSWGDLAHANYDLLAFRISTGINVPIFGVNSPGSFFWCSTSNDGSTVSGTGKRIHAREFGNGGIMYNIYIDTTDTPLSITGAGSHTISYDLKQNFPNPFNPLTQIDYEIPRDGSVNLTVFDVTGREITKLVNKFERAGKYTAVFNAEHLSTGIYFYRLDVNGFTSTKKMTLLK